VGKDEAMKKMKMKRKQKGGSWWGPPETGIHYGMNEK
jgi:hypothetical protein